MEPLQGSPICDQDFRTIIASAIDAFIVVSPSGHVLEANDSYCQMTGYRRDEVVNRHLSEIDPIDDAETVARRAEEIIRAGGLRFEAQHRHKNGSAIDVEVSANYSSIHGGCFVSFIRDISDQRRTRGTIAARLRLMEFALNHSVDELLQRAVDEAEELTGSAIGFFHLVDSDRQMISLNAWSRRTLGQCRPTPERSGHYPLSEAGVWADCIREGRPVIHNDVATLGSKQRFPHGHVAVFREVVVPVFRDKRIVAVLGIGNKPSDYTPWDVKAVSLLADLAWDITERKLIVQELARSEERFRHLFEESQDAVFLTLSDGRVLRANSAACAMFGRSEEEICAVGRDGIMNLDDPRLAAVLKERNRLGRAFTELTCVRKNGEIFPAEVSSVICSRETLETYVIIRDISARKQAEEALKESRAMLQNIVNSTPDAIYAKDRLGRYQLFNNGAERVVGKKADEVLGKDDAFIFPAESAAVIKAQDRQVLEAGAIRTFEEQLPDHSGSQRIFLSTKGPMLDAEGKPVGIFGIARDITDRKLAEVRLTESEHRFRSLFEEMTEGVALHSVVRDEAGTVVNYRIEMVNPAFTRILGIPAEQVVGKLGSEAFGDPAPYLNRYAQVVNSKRSMRFTTNHEPMQRQFEISAMPWESDGFATIFQDVTQKMENEKLQRQQADQLQHTQKLESLGVLAGGIAHDFNNILSIILGNCGLAVISPARTGDCLQHIEKAAERAAELCRQMMVYAGKADSVRMPLELRALTEEMVQMLRSTMGANLAVSFDAAAELPSIAGDASQFRQVVMNLLINAAEAIGEAQGKIAIALAPVLIDSDRVCDYCGKPIPHGRYVCLEVTDNGSGMNEETLRRVFEPFYSTKFAGRGLGMSAVLGIVIGHQGAVQIASTPGSGTTFKVFFPVPVTKVPGPELPAAPDSPEWQGAGTVLLAEDEEQILHIAQLMLEELGFAVVPAANGQEALELFQQHREAITLVLTDVGMPEMDGYVLVKELNRLAPGVPIVVSSGFGDATVAERLADGIAATISKPYRFDRLREVLKRVLSANGGTAV
ncbi:PAS domain S-box protein [Geomesophilobacter sediminis]|uniref:histidine kinase n=1 Tax=Geomesophilobacter sediminis TaxID=2798584 RepID=A0A8J7IP26_9BACT|nr:PAS domain S-box protein [Geomesophilobacter sediminis]MBJ6725193.1 PAS domain S-box protein [Geomesophilobacter sediminis]